MKAIEPTIKADFIGTIWTLSIEGDDFYYEVHRNHATWNLYLVDATDEQEWLLSSRTDTKDVQKIMKKCGITALIS